MRSFSPLPSLTIIWRLSKSMSLTRKRIHSMTRSPPPYITWAISLFVPVRLAMRRLTSSFERTVGIVLERWGRSLASGGSLSSIWRM